MDKTKQLIIGVYKISNIVSGRYYIGYSTNINKRFTVHRSKLKKNCHDNIFLQRAYNLDGEDKFNYEIIHICNSEEEAKTIELQYLNNLSIRDKIYNLNYNNSGGDLLTNHPDKDKIREKIIKSHAETVGKMTTEERKEKYGKLGEKNGMYGKTHTEEARKIFSEVHKGNTYRKGKKASEETKQKMSENAKLKIGEKNPFYGKQHSEETIQKIKEKSKGRLPPNIIKVSIDNIIYTSITEASRQLSIPAPNVLWRLKSKNPKFNNYKYVDEINNFTQPFETLSEDDVDNCVFQNLQPDNH
jgi:group I intron endonuclease